MMMDKFRVYLKKTGRFNTQNFAQEYKDLKKNFFKRNVHRVDDWNSDIIDFVVKDDGRNINFQKMKDLIKSHGALFSYDNSTGPGSLQSLKDLKWESVQTETQSEKGEGMRKQKQNGTIEIQEDVQIPGTDVILEAGDRIEVLTESIDFSLLDRKEFDYVTLYTRGRPRSSIYGVLWPSSRIDKFSIEKEVIDIKLEDGAFITFGFAEINKIELTNRGKILVSVGQEEFKITLE